MKKYPSLALIAAHPIVVVLLVEGAVVVNLLAKLAELVVDIV